MRISFILWLIVSGIVNVFAQTAELSDQVIVKFKEGYVISPKFNNQVLVCFGIAAIDDINKKHFMVSLNKLNMGKDSKDEVYVIKYPKTENIENILKELDATGAFDYTEPDFIGHAQGIENTTPNDTWFARQWGLNNDGTFSCTNCGFTNNPPTPKAGADIKMKTAWDIYKGSSTVKVGFIDTGCKLDHAELTGRIWVNPGEIAGNNIDDDGNGYKDDINGWDFVNNDNNPSDDNGHGTNTAGVVGANGNNTSGFAGVDWNCKLMIAKGLDSNASGLYSQWISAITYLTDKGADIINMSLAGSSYSTTLQNAVTYAYNHNVLLIASMGNNNSGTAQFPAACTYAMAVGATNLDDSRCNPFSWGGGSNYGNHISVCAPGNVIFSLDYKSNTNFGNYWGGTSESAPYTSGVAALLKGQLPSRTATQIRSILEKTADDQVGKPTEDVAGKDQYHGWGRINAYRALSALTDINDLTSPSYFIIYPNPAHQNVQIKLDPVQKEYSEIIITDISGKIIWKKVPVEEVTTCSFNFSPGVYFVSTQINSQTVTRKLLIF